MSMRATLRVLVACSAIIAASSTSAQIFKWVDENGVTTYSNQRPADATAVGEIGVVENRISVYTPDASLLQAVDAFRQRSNEIGVKPAPQARPSREYVTPVYVPVPVVPDPCADERSAHCNEIYTGYYPYVPVVGHGRYRRYKRIPQVHLQPGTTAGNVVGMDGYIPGNSANAPRFGRAPMRSLSRPSLEPRSTGGRAVQLPARLR